MLSYNLFICNKYVGIINTILYNTNYVLYYVHSKMSKIILEINYNLLILIF